MGESLWLMIKNTLSAERPSHARLRKGAREEIASTEDYGWSQN